MNCRAAQERQARRLAETRYDRKVLYVRYAEVIERLRGNP